MSSDNTNPQNKNIESSAGVVDEGKGPREQVKTSTTAEKRKWWEEFRFEVLRKYREALYNPEKKLNNDVTAKEYNDWIINEGALIDENGDPLHCIHPDESNELKLDEDNNIIGFDIKVRNDKRHYRIVSKLRHFMMPTSYFFSKRLGQELCEDLGIEWSYYKNEPLCRYLIKIKSMLSKKNYMPKLRPRYKFLHFCVDNTSNADGKWLIDFIDKNNGQIFGKTWKGLGKATILRKKYLIDNAKPEKKKELKRLLHYKEPIGEVASAKTQTTIPDYDPQLAERYSSFRNYWQNKTSSFAKFFNKFIAGQAWDEQDYKYIFEYDKNRPKNNLDSDNTNNIAQ